jgi:ribosomal protein S18 acetylase RimI-like enzyme
MNDEQLGSGDPPVICRAVATDAGWICELIGVAFQPLAVSQWLVPDPDRRAEVLPANFRIHVEHALMVGQVHATADQSAVAVWFPRDGDRPLPEPLAYEQRLAAACGEATERFRELDELFDRHHPADPHHHLAFLAVRPDQQRQGLGSTLLRHHHAHLDAKGVGAYLEASSAESRNLYLRHGYRVTSAPFHLPDGTPMWPMWRPPADRAVNPDEENDW